MLHHDIVLVGPTGPLLSRQTQATNSTNTLRSCCSRTSCETQPSCSFLTSIPHSEFLHTSIQSVIANRSILSLSRQISADFGTILQKRALKATERIREFRLVFLDIQRIIQAFVKFQNARSPSCLRRFFYFLNSDEDETFYFSCV